MAKGYVGVDTTLYTPLDYIESTGTQYIDTGIVPKSITRMVLEKQITDLTINNRDGWGSTSRAEAFFCGMVTGINYFYASVSANWTATSTTIPKDTAKHTWDISNSAIKFDDISYGTGNIGNTATTSQTLYIFAFHTEYNPYIYYCKEKIYSCKIYDGDTLVKDYIPVLDKNNVACLYEKVSGKFVYNQGTGTFSYGTAGTPIVRRSSKRNKKRLCRNTCFIYAS